MYVNSGITNIHNLATHPRTIWFILHDEGRYYNQFGAIMLWVAGEANNVIKSYEKALYEIVLFLSEQVPGPKPRALTENTTLRDDLRMHNDDAEKLMDSYFERFGVNAQTFDFEKYFPQEGDGIIGTLLFGFLNGKHRQPDPEPLTIAMLAHAASIGAWG